MYSRNRTYLYGSGSFRTGMWKRGIEIKVETQGGMGIDNELEQDEIDEAVELAQN